MVELRLTLWRFGAIVILCRFALDTSIRTLTVSVIRMPFSARTQSKSSNPAPHNGKEETKL